MFKVIVDLTINESPIVLDRITEAEIALFTEHRNSDRLFAKLGNQWIKNKLIKSVSTVERAA